MSGDDRAVMDADNTRSALTDLYVEMPRFNDQPSMNGLFTNVEAQITPRGS